MFQLSSFYCIEFRAHSQSRALCSKPCLGLGAGNPDSMDSMMSEGFVSGPKLVAF